MAAGAVAERVLTKTVMVSGASEQVLLHSRDGECWFQKPAELLDRQPSKKVFAGRSREVRQRFFSCVPDESTDKHLPAEPERTLWAEVLVLAFNDAMGRISEAGSVPPALIQGQAKAWFLSPRRDIGSFRWVCGELGIEPSAVIRTLKTGSAIGRGER
jgi:hypothetical protein